MISTSLLMQVPFSTIALASTGASKTIVMVGECETTPSLGRVCASSAWGGHDSGAISPLRRE